MWIAAMPSVLFPSVLPLLVLSLTVPSGMAVKAKSNQFHKASSLDNFKTTKSFPVKSLIRCAAACHMNGEQCDAFNLPNYDDGVLSPRCQLLIQSSMSSAFDTGSHRGFVKTPQTTALATATPISTSSDVCDASATVSPNHCISRGKYHYVAHMWTNSTKLCVKITFRNCTH